MELNLQELYDELFPLCRSLTGPGYEKSLEILQRYVPFNIESFPSGSKVFDWIVPPAWTLHRATLKDSKGNIILDTNDSVLHVLNYSDPFTGRVSLDELKSHLYYDELNPDAIPYTTSYYKDKWGLNLSFNQFKTLDDEFYDVDIQTEKDPNGSLKIGMCELKGKSDRIVQFSAYLCHPSMLNNELSGPLALICLYQLIKAMPERKYTYRFVIHPETIGSIAYLSNHAEELKERIEYGVHLTCVAAPYKKGGNKDNIISIPLPDASLTEKFINNEEALIEIHDKLLQDFRKSHEHNFLDLPLSFKLSRQSYIDSLSYDVEAWAGAHEPMKQYERGSYFEKSFPLTSSCCSEICNINIDDEDRIEAYRIADAFFDRYYNPNHLPACHIYKDPAIHSFECTYRIDNKLRDLSYRAPDRVTLRCYSANSGSDERQYCSALLNLPIVQATRTEYTIYPGYHCSTDNQDAFSLSSIIDSALELYDLARYYEISDSKPKMIQPCEPQLGRRGLYPDTNAPEGRRIRAAHKNDLTIIMYLSNLSGGVYTTTQLARMLNVSPLHVTSLIIKLQHKGVLRLQD